MNEKTLKYIDFAFATAIYVAITLGIFIIVISVSDRAYKHNICIDLLNKIAIENTPGSAPGNVKKFTNVEKLCDQYSKITGK